MSDYELKPAVSYIKPLKLLMYGPTYAGKTWNGLKIALGIVMKIRGCTEAEAYKHIIMLDSENKRGALYAYMGPYNYKEIEPPFLAEKITNEIDLLNDVNQIDVILIDSLTHYWSKTGGILDRKAKKDAKGGNGYTNWQEFTAIFSEMIDTILQSPKVVIATTRSKNDTVMEANDKNKMVPRTYGLKPDLRDDIDYDFDIVFNVDKQSHNLIMEKGVPGIKNVYEVDGPEIGMELYDLFNAGAVPAPRTAQDVVDTIKRLVRTNNKVQFVQLKLSGKKLDDLELKPLLALEKELLAEIKKDQLKKHN